MDLDMVDVVRSRTLPQVVKATRKEGYIQQNATGQINRVVQDACFLPRYRVQERVCGVISPLAHGCPDISDDEMMTSLPPPPGTLP